MHRSDNSKYLLYIEPKSSEKLKKPILDELTKVMEIVLQKAKKGVASYSDLDDIGNFREGIIYKGFHRTECGETSTPYDFLLENGMITNSLSLFYLKWYRNSIPETEMKKIIELKNFYESQPKGNHE